MEENVIKVASNERVSNMKTFRMVKMTILMFGSSSSDLISRSEDVLGVLRFGIRSMVWPTTSPTKPQMKKYFTWICLRLVEAIDFEF